VGGGKHFLAAFFSWCALAGMMSGLEPCDLHEAATVTGARPSEDLIRLAQSPIGDECQYCPVCRYAREYVERRLAEEAGAPAPSEEGSDDSWRKLQAAVASVKTVVHRPT